MKTMSLFLILGFLSKDSNVVGVYGGRTPCAPQLMELHHISADACNRLKLRLTLYQQADRTSSGTFQLLTVYVGNDDNQYVKTGKWEVVKNSGSQSKGLIYKLEPEGSPVPLLLLEGDNNILFILDQNMTPLVGNADHSYTLNRITK